MRGRRILRLLALAGVPGLLAAAVAWTAIRPSHDRAWVPEHARLPHASIAGTRVRIDDVRNFRYDAGGGAIAGYGTRTVDVDALETVWFVLTPFERERRGPAHAFLSFGFADSQHIAISVEARREAGEAYSLVGGLLKRFELTYVIGDERDLIGNRVLVQDDDVYVYPIRATREQARALFVGMIEAANALYERPAFYGTLRRNCTTVILEHVNRIADPRIPYSWRVLLPGHADEVAHELGLIDTDLSIDAARERFRVNERVERYAEDPAFSVRIRE
jgi:hypothetical protein